MRIIAHISVCYSVDYMYHTFNLNIIIRILVELQRQNDWAIHNNMASECKQHQYLKHHE